MISALQAKNKLLFEKINLTCYHNLNTTYALKSSRSRPLRGCTSTEQSANMNCSTRGCVYLTYDLPIYRLIRIKLTNQQSTPDQPSQWEIERGKRAGVINWLQSIIINAKRFTGNCNHGGMIGFFLREYSSYERGASLGGGGGGLVKPSWSINLEPTHTRLDEKMKKKVTKVKFDGEWGVWKICTINTTTVEISSGQDKPGFNPGGWQEESFFRRWHGAHPQPAAVCQHVRHDRS